MGTFLAQYLPEEEDDDREGEGRSKRGMNQHKQLWPEERRMRTHDPYEAGRRALESVLENQRKSRAKSVEEAQQKQFALGIYWER